MAAGFNTDIITWTLSQTEDHMASAREGLEGWRAQYEALYIDSIPATYGNRDAMLAIARISEAIGDGLGDDSALYHSSIVESSDATTGDQYEVQSLALVTTNDTVYKIHSLVSHPEISGIMNPNRALKYEALILNTIALDAKAERKNLEVVAHLTDDAYIEQSETLLFANAGFEDVEDDLEAGRFTMALKTEDYLDGRITRALTPSIEDLSFFRSL